MRNLTSKDGDFYSYFGEIKKNNNNKKTLREILTDNPAKEANKAELLGQLPLEHIMRFCKTFEKVTKNLDFNILLKTNDLQDLVFSTLPQATIINVSFD